jgi:hypothetical protein
MIEVELRVPVREIEVDVELVGVAVAEPELRDDVVEAVLAEDADDLEVPLGMAREAIDQQGCRGAARGDVVLGVGHAGCPPGRDRVRRR